VKGLHQVMRNALVVSAVILVSLGLDLTILPRDADRSFSWPIQPPLTAGALGSFSLSAFIILALSLAGAAATRAPAPAPAPAFQP
jgi:hypothetical protein